MEQVYKYMGIIVIWGFIAFSSYLVLRIIFEWIINEIASKFRFMWVLFEFAYYRSDFLEWVKDKKRHPKTK